MELFKKILVLSKILKLKEQFLLNQYRNIFYKRDINIK